jgi:hypothetical protein
MKRIMGLLLLCLLLCGCAVQYQSQSTQPSEITLPPTEPTEPPGIYVPFSDLETQTDGAVRYYLPEGGDCYGIRVIGNDVLAFSGVDVTTLTRYAGEQLFAVASIRLDCRIEPEETSFQISANGITYYNPESREVVFLDNDLKEVSRLGMSDDLVGKPILSANRMQVYYCTADAVRVYDTASGLDRLLKTISYEKQTVENILLNDTVLRCSLEDDRGQKYTIFISTQTGELLSQIFTDAEVTTREDCYYALVRDGIQELKVFGRVGEDPQVLTPADPFAFSWFLEETNGLITATVTEENTRLDCYELTTGCRSASVELPRGIEPQFAEVHPETGEAILMAYDSLADAPVILFWNMDALPVLIDDLTYVGPRYTAEDPDLVGLDACRIRAESISEQYGVRVLIGEDAVQNQPWDYTLELEYQTSVIFRQLRTLETVLSRFPEGFFQKLPRKVTFCVVRSIQGNAESGSLAQAQGVQFWDGYEPYVALASGDTLEGAFFHEMFHVLDSKVLSDTQVYYRWHLLNPDEFSYFGDYTTYLTYDASEYLQDENRVFIDAYSMCHAKEDRARIMEYACQPGNERYFQSEVMQNKLRTLCQGIRAAFGLKDHPESFLWEQYLTEPLTIK